MAENTKGMLSPYRVLDLADETSYLCGKVLGDLGADVIKVEPPGGDPGRSLGPFYHDEPHPEKSLFWFAYNNNKRGITLNLETSDGQEIFKRLVKTADIVIETFPPGYLKKLGLSYPQLEKINPKIIMLSVTPFGQVGPWKNYKAPDIVAWGLCGQMYTWGEADRPPIRISHHSQAHLHSAMDAVVGVIMALYYRRITGEGQQISSSILESSVRSTASVPEVWDQLKIIMRRGELDVGRAVRTTTTWPCKDGLILWSYGSGPQGKRNNQSFVHWLETEGAAVDFLKGVDWDTFGTTPATQEVVQRAEAIADNFFRSRTKAELFVAASKMGDIELYPVATTKDILEDIQLAARHFFVKLEHSELGTSIPYPGPFVQTTKAAPEVRQRAPFIGEHNLEIYEKELGISRNDLVILKQVGVI